MRDGWFEATLGELCSLTKGTTATMKATPGPYPLVVTAEGRASSSDWQFDTPAVCIPMVSSTGHGHASLKRVHYQDGRFAVANIITACVAKADAPVDMRFLWLLLDHGRDELIVPLMKGTANVSLSQQSLAGLRLTLPPVAEQRRIVDLVGAIDHAIEAATGSLNAALVFMAEVRSLPASARSQKLGDLVTMRSGPSWASGDESSTEEHGFEPVLGITNTPAGSALDLSTRKYVRGLAPSVQRLTEHSLVAIRTNGNRSRIGNVYRATAEVVGFAVSAFQIAIEPHDATDSAWLYWVLGSSEVQRAISESASGSTGLGNIAVGWLKQLDLPLLTEEVRADYVDRCEAAGKVVDSLALHLDRLGALRSNLLTAVLSGEHEIPESYDRLLVEAS